MSIDTSKWKKTTNRFVAFFDIMGFKEIVERNKHLDVVEKLNSLKKALDKLEKAGTDKDFSTRYSISETKSITFSDSIIIFSKGDTVNDACKIILDSGFLIQKSLESGIAIKGALSYGETTVDFENSLFFGRPIIDSYLLHDLLQIYTAVLDNHFEAKINSFTLPEPFNDLVTTYKANFKTGKITHKLIRPDEIANVEKQISFTTKLQETVSGTPRIYVDNTMDFLKSLLLKSD